MVLISTHTNKLKREIQAIRSKPIIEQLPLQGDELNPVPPLEDATLPKIYQFEVEHWTQVQSTTLNYKCVVLVQNG